LEKNRKFKKFVERPLKEGLLKSFHGKFIIFPTILIIKKIWRTFEKKKVLIGIINCSHSSRGRLLEISRAVKKALISLIEYWKSS
jgi:hypothetical protein